MPRYEFIERVHIYYTVSAKSEDEAWNELQKLEGPFNESWDKNISVDVVQCEINDIFEEKANA